jgi:hypothetical protein
MNDSPPGPEPARNSDRVRRCQALFIIALGLWVLVRNSLVTRALWPNRVMRAEMEMSAGLVLLWIVAGGALMFIFRSRIKAFLQSIPWNWRLSFFLVAILLALCEELITTLMTNCAPLFGVRPGQAYITASANYFDVVCCHSVITFLPVFAVWAGFLSRYDFSPFEVFVCFGVYGSMGEGIFGGFHPADLPFWILVYGLMVYLPAYAFSDQRGKRRVSWAQYLMAAGGPFVAVIPWVLFLKLTFLRHHPDLHFPPIITK